MLYGEGKETTATCLVNYGLRSVVCLFHVLIHTIKATDSKRDQKIHLANGQFEQHVGHARTYRFMAYARGVLY